MSSLWLAVLPLALGAAVSPTLLALQVLILSGAHEPLRRAWAFAAGSGGVLLVYSFLGVTVLRQFGDAGTGAPSAASSWLKIAAAVLLVGIAVRQLMPRRTAGEAHQSRTAGRLATAPAGFFLGVGALAMLTNVSSLVLYLPALHEIVRSDASTAVKVAVYAVLFLITMLPVLVPVVLVWAMGERSASVLAALHSFVTAHQRQINAGICLFFAVYLGWSGIHGLL